MAVFVAFNFQAYAQEKVNLEKPAVEKNTELLSIVFRLAGRQEYSSKQFKLYTDRIDQHFEQYKNHVYMLKRSIVLCLFMNRLI